MLKYRSIKKRDHIQQKFIWLIENRNFWNDFPVRPPWVQNAYDPWVQWQATYGKIIVKAMQADGILSENTYWMDVPLDELIRDIREDAPIEKYFGQDSFFGLPDYDLWKKLANLENRLPSESSIWSNVSAFVRAIVTEFTGNGFRL